MPDKISLGVCFSVLFFFLLFYPGEAPAMEEAREVRAMEEMGEEVLANITAGQYLTFTRVIHENPPVELGKIAGRVYVDGNPYTSVPFWEDPKPVKGMIIGGRPLALSLKALQTKTWVMEEGVFDGERTQLWLVIDVMNVQRNYYDFGWEMEHGDQVRQVWKDMDFADFTGVDGLPVKVKAVVHQINYDPIPYEWLTVNEPVYHADDSVYGRKSTQGVQEIFYRRGYWVVFKY